MQGQSFVLSILYLPLKTTSALLNLAFLFRIVEIFSGLNLKYLPAITSLCLSTKRHLALGFMFVTNEAII